jgi:hypothetical protein
MTPPKKVIHNYPVDKKIVIHIISTRPFMTK